jgi:hypothetical protein
VVSAHNLKVTGSNPVPATKSLQYIKTLRPAKTRGFCMSKTRGSTVEARGGEVLHITAKLSFAEIAASCASGFASSVKSPANKFGGAGSDCSIYEYIQVRQFPTAPRRSAQQWRSTKERLLTTSAAPRWLPERFGRRETGRWRVGMPCCRWPWRACGLWRCALASPAEAVSASQGCQPRPRLVNYRPGPEPIGPGTKAEETPCST